MRTKLGLDRPLVEQYLGHIFGLLRGDFGYSSTFRGNPLWPILERLPATLLLAASAIALTVLVGVPVGVVAGAPTRVVGPISPCRASVVTLLAVPNFWLGHACSSPYFSVEFALAAELWLRRSCCR